MIANWQRLPGHGSGDRAISEFLLPQMHRHSRWNREAPWGSVHFQDGTLGAINFDSKLFFHRFSLIFLGYEGYENSGGSRPLCRLGRRQGRYRRQVSPYPLLLCT